MINPAAGGAKYPIVADDLRARIQAGEWPPGGRFLTERQIQQEYDIARGTARRVMDMLERDGLIVVLHPHGTRVNDTRHVDLIDVAPGQLVGARPATAQEADRWRIPPGFPVLVLRDAQTQQELGAWPADRTQARPA